MQGADPLNKQCLISTILQYYNNTYSILHTVKTLDQLQSYCNKKNPLTEFISLEKTRGCLIVFTDMRNI